MATHYDILGCQATSSYEELKTAYHKLALEHHPDRSNMPSETFQKIDEAWKVLRDQDLRKNYDEALKQSEIEEHSLLFGTFTLQDLAYDTTSEMYSCDCRCGGSYSFTKKDFEEFNSYLVGCDECSLMISVDLQA